MKHLLGFVVAALVGVGTGFALGVLSERQGWLSAPGQAQDLELAPPIESVAILPFACERYDQVKIPIDNFNENLAKLLSANTKIITLRKAHDARDPSRRSVWTKLEQGPGQIAQELKQRWPKKN